MTPADDYLERLKAAADTFNPVMAWARDDRREVEVWDACAADLRSAIAEIEAGRERLNTPELLDFAQGVVREAVHQRERWSAQNDAGKAPEDWFWLLGYLGGKALSAAKSGDADKALHHTISTAAALANWHAALLGSSNTMRPGIDAKERGYD